MGQTDRVCPARLRSGTVLVAVHRRGSVKALDHVEQHATTNINDRCRPALAEPFISTNEQRVVETECIHVTDALRVVEERATVASTAPFTVS
jgi:hypothetical protein